MLTYDDNQKATKVHCRLAFSTQPKRFFLPLLVGVHGSTDTTARKSAIEEMMFWKVTLPSTLIFFCKIFFARLTLQFPSTYICICNRVRSVSFSKGEFRDRDSCLVKFPALEANSWQRRASSSVFFFSSFFFPSFCFSIFSRSNSPLTQTRKVRTHAERPKGDREQFASLDFWIKCFTRDVHLVSNRI